MTKARGFTLLEVAVAVALMAIVLGTASAIMAMVLNDGRRSRAHSEMLRDGTFVSELLNSELRQAGLGVPPSFDNNCNPDGFHIRKTCTTGVGCTALYGTAPVPLNFSSSVIVAAATQVGIVGDLPRPDAQYSAYGPLHNRPTGQSDSDSAQWLVWHNENNGACAPGNGCTLTDFSTFFTATPAQPAAQLCSVGSPNARTCPWGMRRVLPGERLQIVAGDFSWSHAALDAGPTVGDVGGGRLAVKLNPGFDVNNPTSATFISDGTWANRQRGDGPGGIRGVGWVTTLDRVFFFHDAATKTLKRIQCFGDPDPNNPAWPDASQGAMPGTTAAALALTPATSGGVPAAPNTCIGPDIVARNVDSVQFAYFNAANGALAAPVTGVNPPTCPTANVVVQPTAGKSAVKRIDYVINFKKSVDGVAAHDVTHSVRGSVRLQNLL